MMRLLRLQATKLLGLCGICVLGTLGCGEAQPRISDAKPAVSILAVGDTGRPHNWFPSMLEGQISVANGMAAEDQREPVEAVVLLGDNFYDDGLVRETMPAQIRQNVAYPYCQFVALDGPRSDEIAGVCKSPRDKNQPTQILAVLGNHDLITEGSPQLQCQEVEDFISNWTLPCGYAQTIELDGGLSVILFNSEKRGDKDQTAQLEEAIRNSKGPWRVLASHRPITMDDDSQPLDRGGWIDRLVGRAGVPVHAIASGHHHNLQLFETPGSGPNLHAIVGSGARARGRPPNAVAHPARRFGTSKLGFARIDVLDSGEGERLYVSLFSTPKYPILATGDAELVARWSVDHEGQTRNELPSAKTR
jgi:hypothetical protein